ncbi:unnamed protein product [Penicillium palitans]
MTNLSDYGLLCFDVYGTLIDWENGIITALEPILSKSTTQFTREHLLTTYQDLESTQQTATPDLPYSDLLSAIHPTLAARLGLNPPTEEESRAFGNSVGTWPAFPDTVDALHRLSKHYKLVVLSNVDRASFAKSNAGSLQGDIGSYKPDPRNFEYMLSAVQREFGVGSGQVLQTAQSQFHDHQPARKVGIKSVWIERSGALMGNTGDPIFDWRFETLGGMADAVEAQ